MSLDDFLLQHSAKATGASPTHTRIGSQEHKIYGGSYNIVEDLPQFYALYQRHIAEGKKEYLTERQIENGPLLVDFDFRYSADVTTRQHTMMHIGVIIQEYLLELASNFYEFTDDKSVIVYVMEKPNVNRIPPSVENGVAKDGLTKDGIHIIFGLQVPHQVQLILRERMIAKFSRQSDDNELSVLPLTVTWDKVLDEGISKGCTNWQLYGSRKPGNEAYTLVAITKWTIDPDDPENYCIQNDDPPKKREVERDIWRLSAQNPTHPSFALRPSMQEELARRTTAGPATSKKPKRRINIARTSEEEEAAALSSNYGEIDTEEKLDLAISYIMGRLAYNEQHIKETHDFTMILPAKFYEAGSHDWNRKVAFALKHTDEDRLFLTWIKLRSKAADFDYGDIPARYIEWTKNMNRNDDSRSVTRNSILFWARTENPEEYTKIKLGGLNHYVDMVIASPTDHSFALLAHQMKRDTYVCTDYKNRTWYQYSNHRWVSDRGNTLRRFLSSEMHAIFADRHKQANTELRIEQANASENNADKIKLMTGAVKNLRHILDKLYTSGPKDAIMRECVEVFYDPLFTARMDSDPRLIGFTNGVVDFHTNVFRPGQPQDYITMSTHVEYIPTQPSELTESTQLASPLGKAAQVLSSGQAQLYVDEVREFMGKLFPDPDLRRYVWQYLASVLIGTRMNQTLHFMVGSGANGKSALMDALGFALGDYKRGVPANLLCGKRVATGGVSPEVIVLKGCRLGIIQEPSRTEVIQDGLLKELSTEKYLQGRALYCDPETFPAQFSLGICLNTLLEMPSNDDGTWRRIRVVPFESKFIGVGENHTTESKYIYEKDPDMEEKIERWGTTFASMLVDLAFQTHGKLERCEIVEKAGKSYRESQDILAAFINERIATDTTSSPPACIKQGQLSREFTEWCKECRRGSRTPKPQELFDVMNKRFGEPKNGFWHGLRIITNNDVAADVPVAMPVETKSAGF